MVISHTRGYTAQRPPNTVDAREAHRRVMMQPPLTAFLLTFGVAQGRILPLVVAFSLPTVSHSAVVGRHQAPSRSRYPSRSSRGQIVSRAHKARHHSDIGCTSAAPAVAYSNGEWRTYLTTGGAASGSVPASSIAEQHWKGGPKRTPFRNNSTVSTDNGRRCRRQPRVLSGRSGRTVRASGIVDSRSDEEWSGVSYLEKAEGTSSSSEEDPTAIAHEYLRDALSMTTEVRRGVRGR